MAVISLGVFLAVWVGFWLQNLKRSRPITLLIKGADSRIYVASQTTSYGYAEKDYTSSDGQTVAVGSDVFTINLTLRNDYSSDNPPPTSGTPIAPIDGTAYIRLKAALFNNDVDHPNNKLSAHQTSPRQQTNWGLFWPVDKQSTLNYF